MENMVVSLFKKAYVFQAVRFINRARAGYSYDNVAKVNI